MFLWLNLMYSAGSIEIFYLYIKNKFFTQFNENVSSPMDSFLFPYQRDNSIIPF